jgi:hypothetical protein
MERGRDFYLVLIYALQEARVIQNLQDRDTRYLVLHSIPNKLVYIESPAHLIQHASEDTEDVTIDAPSRRYESGIIGGYSQHQLLDA